MASGIMKQNLPCLFTSNPSNVRSISAGFTDLEIDMSQNGYTCLGIVGVQFASTDRSKLYLVHYYYDDGSKKAIIGVNSAIAQNVTPIIRGIYIRSN